MAESHKALVRRFLEEIHNKGNLEAVPEFIHSNHVRHTNRTVGGGRDFHGPAGFRQAVEAFRRAFSEVHFTEEEAAPRPVNRRVGLGKVERLGVELTSEALSVMCRHWRSVW